MFKRITKTLRACAQFIFDLYEAQRGIKSFTRVLTAEDLYELLEIRVGHVQKTTIFCQQESYACTFNHLWPRHRDLTVFKVYAECSPDTPEHIKKLFETEMTIPHILHSGASNALHSRMAIEAYLAYIHAIKSQQ